MSLIPHILFLARYFFSTVPQSEKQKIKKMSIEDESDDEVRGYQMIDENVTGKNDDLHEEIDWYRPIPLEESFDEYTKAEQSKERIIVQPYTKPQSMTFAALKVKGDVWEIYSPDAKI